MNQTSGQVLIILAPAEHAYHQISNIPPLALGVLKGYLTDKGKSTDIYDLDVTVNKRVDELPMSMWGFIYDSKRIIDYLQGESDQEIEAWEEPDQCECLIKIPSVESIVLSMNQIMKRFREVTH